MAGESLFEKPGEGKGRGEVGLAPARECGRANDGSETDGAKPAGGRNKARAGAIGSNGKKPGDADERRRKLAAA